MSEELKDGVAQPEGAEAPAQVEEKAPRDIELDTLREKVAKYEQLVVSPEYADFLAAKAAEKVAQKTGAAPRQYSDDEKRAFEERLNSMTRAQYAAFVRDLTVETVKDQMFDPLVTTMVGEKVKTQIAEAASEFPDFWDYKQDMIALSNANPNLSAKQAYHLAKSQRPAPAQPQGKPPVRKPSGEAPTAAVAGRKEAPPDTFAQAFEQAFKKVGL